MPSPKLPWHLPEDGHGLRSRNLSCLWQGICVNYPFNIFTLPLQRRRRSKRWVFPSGCLRRGVPIRCKPAPFAVLGLVTTDGGHPWDLSAEDILLLAHALGFVLRAAETGRVGKRSPESFMTVRVRDGSQGIRISGVHLLSGTLVLPLTWSTPVLHQRWSL